MSKEKLIEIVSFIAIIISVIAIVMSFSDKAVSFGRMSGYNKFSGGVTNATTSVPKHVVQTADATLVSRNVNRQYLKVCNLSGTDVYLHFTNSTSSIALEEGIPLLATSSCYEIETDNLYVGTIMGIADATTTISVLEK